MSSQNYKDKLEQFVNENNEIKFAQLEGENTAERVANHYKTLMELLKLSGLQEILESGNQTESTTEMRLMGGLLIEKFLRISTNIGIVEAEDNVQHMLVLIDSGNVKLKSYQDFLNEIGDGADTRLSNLADDLNETEQDEIKTKLGVGDYNGVTPTITEDVITSYSIDPQLETEHWNLTMTGDTDFDFANMFDTDNSKVITITLKGDYAFTFPIWLKPLETNDEYDTIGGTLVAEIVINIKNGGTTPSGYYSLQMVDYAL